MSFSTDSAERVATAPIPFQILVSKRRKRLWTVQLGPAARGALSPEPAFRSMLTGTRLTGGTRDMAESSHLELGLFARIRARLFGFDVFISYSHKDALGYALALENQLRARGIISFRDAREIAAGAHLKRVVEWALRKSRRLVLVDSPCARKSDWVAWEVTEFQKLGRQVAQIQFEEGPPRWIGVDQYVHVAEKDKAALAASLPSEEVVRKIVDAVGFGRVQTLSHLALTLTLLALVTLSAGLWTQYNTALEQRARAVRERDQAENLVDFLVKDLRDSLAPVGRLDVLRGPATKALEYFEATASDSPERMLLHRRALLNLGNVARDADDLESAQGHFGAALRLAEKLREQAYPSVAEATVRVGDSEVFLARTALARRQIVNAERRARAALEAIEPLLKNEGAELEWHRIAIDARTTLARIALARGDALNARRWHQENRDRLAALLLAFPNTASLGSDEVVALSGIVGTFLFQGDHANAQPWADEAIDLAEKRGKSGAFDEQRALSALLSQVGRVHQASARHQKAVEAFERALELSGTLVSHDPANLRWRADLATSHDDLANVYLQTDRHEDAARSYEEALAIRESLRQADPGNPEWTSAVGTSWHKLGKCAVAKNDWTAAAEHFEKSNELFEALMKPGSTTTRQRLAVNDRLLAESYANAGVPNRASEACQRSASTIADLAEIDPDNKRWKLQLLGIRGLCAKLAVAPSAETISSGGGIAPRQSIHH